MMSYQKTRYFEQGLLMPPDKFSAWRSKIDLLKQVVRKPNLQEMVTHDAKITFEKTGDKPKKTLSDVESNYEDSEEFRESCLGYYYVKNQSPSKQPHHQHSSYYSAEPANRQFQQSSLASKLMAVNIKDQLPFNYKGRMGSCNIYEIDYPSNRFTQSYSSKRSRIRSVGLSSPLSQQQTKFKTPHESSKVISNKQNGVTFIRKEQSEKRDSSLNTLNYHNRQPAGLDESILEGLPSAELKSFIKSNQKRNKQKSAKNQKLMQCLKSHLSHKNGNRSDRSSKLQRPYLSRDLIETQPLHGSQLNLLFMRNQHSALGSINPLKHDELAKTCIVVKPIKEIKPYEPETRHKPSEVSNTKSKTTIGAVQSNEAAVVTQYGESVDSRSRGGSVDTRLRNRSAFQSHGDTSVLVGYSLGPLTQENTLQVKAKEDQLSFTNDRRIEQMIESEIGGIVGQPKQIVKVHSQSKIERLSHRSKSQVSNKTGSSKSRVEESTPEQVKYSLKLAPAEAAMRLNSDLRGPDSLLKSSGVDNLNQSQVGQVVLVQETELPLQGKQLSNLVQVMRQSNANSDAPLIHEERSKEFNAYSEHSRNGEYQDHTDGSVVQKSQRLEQSQQLDETDALSPDKTSYETYSKDPSQIAGRALNTQSAQSSRIYFKEVSESRNSRRNKDIANVKGNNVDLQISVMSRKGSSNGQLPKNKQAPQPPKEATPVGGSVTPAKSIKSMKSVKSKQPSRQVLSRQRQHRNKVLMKVAPNFVQFPNLYYSQQSNVEDTSKAISQFKSSHKVLGNKTMAGVSLTQILKKQSHSKDSRHDRATSQILMKELGQEVIPLCIKDKRNSDIGIEPPMDRAQVQFQNKLLTEQEQPRTSIASRSMMRSRKEYLRPWRDAASSSEADPSILLQARMNNQSSEAFSHLNTSFYNDRVLDQTVKIDIQQAYNSNQSFKKQTPGLHTQLLNLSPHAQIPNKQKEVSLHQKKMYKLQSTKPKKAKFGGKNVFQKQQEYVQTKINSNYYTVEDDLQQQPVKSPKLPLKLKASYNDIKMGSQRVSDTPQQSSESGLNQHFRVMPLNVPTRTNASQVQQDMLKPQGRQRIKIDKIQKTASSQQMKNGDVLTTLVVSDPLGDESDFDQINKQSKYKMPTFGTQATIIGAGGDKTKRSETDYSTKAISQHASRTKTEAEPDVIRGVSVSTDEIAEPSMNTGGGTTVQQTMRVVNEAQDSRESSARRDETQNDE